jgi:two-component sensor histidine kinase
MPARLFNYGLRPQRIRTFLILFALALTLPLLGLAVFALNRMASLERDAIERRVVQVAQDLAGDIDRELDRAMATLETLATSAALARGDFGAFHNQAIRALKPSNAAIILVDNTYQQLLNTRAPYGETLPQTADPETARRVFETKQRQVSDVFMGRVSRRHVINAEVPVFDGDVVRYVLIMALDATRFEGLLRAQRLERQWITGITDKKGIILARSERHADFVGKPLPKDLLEQSRAAKGVFRATSVAGDEILRATVRSQATGWLVSATMPLSDVEAPRRRGQLFASALAGTALALGLALAYIFGGFMARPLDAATTAAAAVGLGKHVEPLESPLAEANTLTAALSAASLELQRRQEHSAFLMRELAHRSKNQLAVVKGMALQTARQSGTVDEFVDHFTQRIQGLAESQDLMVRQNWQGAWLSDLVRAHLDLFGARARVRIEGPALFLGANAVQNIGFALHELATNAFKHGALSTPAGSVHVSWRGPDEDQRVYLEWLERDGPSVQPPPQQGFGHLVITELVAQALQGSAKLEFKPEGIHWQLDIPASHVLSVPAATISTSP